MAQVELGGLLYEIDESGRISKRRGRGFLKCFPDRDGYLKVSITTSNGTYNEFLHRIVYRTFIGEIPKSMTVDHIDNDKLNNHFSNLQLLNGGENAIKGNALYWVITKPSGEEFVVYNLEEFCRENKLHSRHIASSSYKGWKARHADY